MDKQKKSNWYKSKWTFLVITIILIVGILYWMAYIPRNIVNLNADKISKIQLFQMGERFYTTDEVVIEEIVENFSTLIFKRDSIDNFNRGSDIYISFYNLKDKEIMEFSILNEKCISYNGFFFHIISGTMNYAELENYLTQS